MKNLSVSFLFLSIVLVLSSGCMMEPKELITIVAPAGTEYICYVNGESVGNVDEKGITVEKEPGTHTVSWERDGETIEVTAWLPVTDDLLNILLESPLRSGESLYIYRSWGEISQYGTASDAGRGSSPIGSISDGRTFEASLNVPNSCAQIKSNIECTVGLPYTFLAEVRIDIFDECIQEENEGEEEGGVEKMNYEIKSFAFESFILQIIDLIKIIAR